MSLLKKFIEIEDKKYPDDLRKIKKPPKRLFYRGDINLLNTNCFAVVGSRSFTEYGKYVEKKIVKVLVNAGLTIVSRTCCW